MTLYLCREEKREDGIFSELRDASGKVLFHTAEHAYNSEPKIPDGTYTCKRRLSPHFGYDLFQVMDVPNCDFIEIHRGNNPGHDNVKGDSEGCILLGMEQVGNTVVQSAIAFNSFMQSLSGIDSFTLVVS